MNFTFFFQIGGADAPVNVKGGVPVAQSGFGADDPGIVVAENRAVFLESGGIGGDLTQFGVILRVAGTEQFHAVLAQ